MNDEHPHPNTQGRFKDTPPVSDGGETAKPGDRVSCNGAGYVLSWGGGTRDDEWEELFTDRHGELDVRPIDAAIAPVLSELAKRDRQIASLTSQLTTAVREREEARAERHFWYVGAKAAVRERDPEGFLAEYERRAGGV